MAFRGSFRPITYVGIDMIKSSYSLFKRDPDHYKDDTITLCEITMNNLLNDGNYSEQDFLERVNILNGMGQNVMVSSFMEYYRLVSHLNKYKIKNLRIIVGVLAFRNVLKDTYYKDLQGGILEAFGKMFTDNMKLYLYPTRNNEKGELINSHNIEVPLNIKYLYKHLIENRKILDIPNVKESRLHIQSKTVHKLIIDGDPAWEEMVPKYISKSIKSKGLFGYSAEDKNSD